MRPLSKTANLFSRVWDGLPIILWLVGCGGIYWYAAAWGLPLFVSVPVSVLGGVTVFHFLRPVRKFLQIKLSKMLAGSPVRPLMETGVWNLLKVAHRYWPNEPVTDFVGLAALHETYDRLNEGRRRRMLEIISEMQAGPVGNGARDFLDEVSPT